MEAFFIEHGIPTNLCFPESLEGRRLVSGLSFAPALTECRGINV
jgi:hypothetical protein